MKKIAREFNGQAQLLLDRWRKLSTTRRSQAIFGLCAFLIVFYALIIYPAGYRKLETLRYREEKLNVRIKNSGGSFTPGKQAKDELSTEQARREIARIDVTLEAMKAEEKRFTERFLAPGDLEGLQILKSALAELAESGDMEVIAIEHGNARAAPALKPDAAGDSNNPYKRPLLHFKARTSYRGLMRFLDGLGELPYIAAPVWSDIHIGGERRAKPNDNASATLEVEIRLAI
ncbi:MAG: hypothetical protein LBF93_10825 [Zoogloeaceae bacterium]|jgi:hypothetical protein|nr:hypothetical protein [Zoogloeaceae bacterium]